jgi:hypothetical protein
MFYGLTQNAVGSFVLRDLGACVCVLRQFALCSVFSVQVQWCVACGVWRAWQSADCVLGAASCARAVLADHNLDVDVVYHIAFVQWCCVLLRLRLAACCLLLVAACCSPLAGSCFGSLRCVCGVCVRKSSCELNRGTWAPGCVMCVCVCVCVCVGVGGWGGACRCYPGSRSESHFEPLLAV